MRMGFSGERVLAVVAHPDDAELLCAGTLGRARQDGASVGICVMSRGEKGQPPEAVEDLGALRRGEMQESAQVLGAELFLLDGEDGALKDDRHLRWALSEVFRQFRPSLVLAPAPEDYHPDHRAASSLAEAASWLSTSPGLKTASAPLLVPPSLWWMDTVEMLGFDPGFFIDISAHIELKRRMLACHRSQLKRSAQEAFSALDELMLHQATCRGRQAGCAFAEAFRQHTVWKRVRAW